ncbi:GFA family protein [Luminiphilus sp.]|nr:GFA family protein [Luminiphilus sp.]
MMVIEFKGSCECGDVTYTVTGPLRPTIACHCTQCRKISGHYWAATQVPNTHFTINKNNGLKWFRSSEWARRGFCSGCGSSLFWQMDSEDATFIGSGTFDDLSFDATTVDKHICVADKGVYYSLNDGLPQFEKW